MPGVSKIIVSGETIADITADTVTSDSLSTGVTAISNTGEALTGAMGSADNSPEYCEFSTPCGSIYAVKTGEWVTVNTQKDFSRTKMSRLSLSLPWEISEYGGGCTGYMASNVDRNTYYLYSISGGTIKWNTCNAMLNLTSAACGFGSSNLSDPSIPKIETWVWSTDALGALSDGSEIVACKMGNIVSVHGTVILAADHLTDGEYFAIASVPFGGPEKPVAFTFGYSYDLTSSRLGAVLEDGTIQLQSVADSSSIFVAKKGTRQGSTVWFTATYSLDFGTKVN